ncbi:TIGR03564 family F420-dependent LLM class oxidoreductase [Amycolatopsis suaedae]|uniref:TIGR03564 family F420-dependent LLM class oxidoreductase n=1 Tax=Amycolatopsis suaedae TaxID=2510978 RepID=A0A4Q7J4V4_9PSEU|nr:TIGR03564 family F420-dependent LLM class oxidoreductase [Amycolatopsis suaedae]RZQ62600.1 TIGR03564 family F420-dependent LLM class oxidoreductase [Amycolatopsis suaedae]
MRIGPLINPAATAADMVDAIEAAERAGFPTAWTNQAPGQWDPLAVLAASRTPLDVGTSVVPTQPRHPVVLATEARTVQSLIGGRLSLGIGPSHAWYISDQLGLPYDKPARHTREYLRILGPLLRGEPVKHQGEEYTVDTQLAIKGEAPDLLLAATGPVMIKIAAEMTDGLIATWVRPDLVDSYLVPRLGPGRRVMVGAMISVTDDPDGVRAWAAEAFAGTEDMPAYRAVLDRGGLSGPADAVIAGDEATVAAEVARFRDAGVTDLGFVPLGSPAEQERTAAVLAG